jgi:hypothetical protein
MTSPQRNPLPELLLGTRPAGVRRDVLVVPHVDDKRKVVRAKLTSGKARHLHLGCDSP